MHVLVIGGNRFVGWLLGQRLLAGGHRLTLFNRGRLQDPFRDRVERLTGDRTTSDFERLLAGRTFDAVVDLAAFTGEDGRRAAALFDGRVGHYVMISTGQVYLVREGAPAPAREADYDGRVMARPTRPEDVGEWEYGVGKRACEDALAEAWARSRFPATRVRIPMVNGERDYYRRLERYVVRLLDGGPVLLPDGGAHRVRHVYGGEVARFVAELLGRGTAFGRAFNLAQEETPTLAELVGRLRALVGSRSALVPVASERLRAEGLVPELLSPFSHRWMSFVDPTEAREVLGFRHEALEPCLGRIVASLLAFPGDTPPPGLERRADELRLAADAPSR